MTSARTRARAWAATPDGRRRGLRPRSRPGGVAGRASVGIAQVLRPRSSRTAGSRSILTTIASRNTALAMASPNIASTRSPLIANAPKTATITAAAAVITRPVRDRPSLTAALGVASSLPLLVHAGDEEDLVVHREAEHDREREHRDERVDRAGLGSEQSRAPAALEHGLDDPERSPDREQVHERRLYRNHERTEHDQQQQRRERRRRPR